MSEPEFSILLDRKDDGSELKGISMSPLAKILEIGIAEPIQAVQEAGLIQIPTYLSIKGRILADKDSNTWSYRTNTLGERNTIKIHRRYKLHKSGLYIVDIQNAGLFANTPEVMIDQIKKNQLYNGSVRITREMKDLLFGGSMVHAWNDGGIEPVQVDYFFKSYGEFLEASVDKEFLAFNKKTGRLPIYVVLRPADQKIELSSKYSRLNQQYDDFLNGDPINNPDIVIPSGGLEQAENLVDKIKKSGWTEFCSRNDGYKDKDRGRIVTIDEHSKGITSNTVLISPGNSVGVDPKKLQSFYTGK